MAYRPRPQPNPQIEQAKAFTNEFLADTANTTNIRIQNLIARNAALGGDPRGYTFQGIRYSSAPTTEFIPDILPVLEKDAEALYLRAQNLQAFRTKLTQALVSILSRCGDNIHQFRDALPEPFVSTISLAVYPRTRAEGFMLKAQPTLAASYRVIDEAVLFLNRYRLLD